MWWKAFGSSDRSDFARLCSGSKAGRNASTDAWVGISTGSEMCETWNPSKATIAGSMMSSASATR